MNKFLVYLKGSGQIVRAGWCSENDVPNQAANEYEAVIEASDVDISKNMVLNGQVVPLPVKPSVNHIFNYATKQWEDPRTLADFKAAKWGEIKQARDKAEFGGFAWDGSRFDSDAISQQRIQGLVHIANLDPNMTVQWTLADNTTRTLSSTDAVQVGKALAAHVNEAHMNARVLRDAIESATTPEQVQAIGWES